MLNKRVFISGGAGVIGSALVQKLLDLGAVVFVGDLKPCPPNFVGKVKYWQGDLNEIKTHELKEFDPEIFFHLAATFERSEETYEFFKENFHNNIRLSHHLMACLKDSHALKKVVFASSYLIYDPLLYSFKQPSVPVVLNENTFIYPRNICGGAKLLHEIELRHLDTFLNKQMTVVSARIFRVYGRGSKDIISRWVRDALMNTELSVFRPEGQFDYIFADDVAEGLIKLAEASFSGVVNLGSGHARAVQDVLGLLKTHFPELKWNEVSSTIPFESSQADIRLLKEITKWEPQETLETAIPKIIEFERSKIKVELPALFPAVLITSISKKVPLIQAVREATKKLGQFKFLIGCDSNENAIAKYFVDEFWNCPVQNELKIQELLDYCNYKEVRAIIPTRDGELLFYAKNRDLLLQNGIKVMISSEDTVLSCLDKKKFADTLVCQGLPVIPTFFSADELKTDRYVVKERFGAGSRQIGLDLSYDDAISHSKQLENPIFQPYIEGNEWSVDLYRSFKDRIIGCVCRQRNSVVSGESQITTTASKPNLEELCSEIALFLNINGHVVFQVIEDAEGSFHVIECNPRFGGASTASLAVGLDSFYWFLLESMEIDLPEKAFLRSSGEIRQIRHAEDKVLPWS